MQDLARAASMPQPLSHASSPYGVAPQPASGPSGLMALLQDEAFLSRLLGTSEDCVSALRSLQLPDSFWTDEFKVVPCQKTTPHKWTLCPCSHAGETARRRCPRSVNYKPVLCPLVKAKKTCPLGDACSYAHNVFEHWLHPARYKTRLCSFGRNCNRAICFFAHSAEELRCPPNADDGKEADERDYLVQLIMAQESGLLPQGSLQQQLQAQQHLHFQAQAQAAAAAAAAVPAMHAAAAAAAAGGLPDLGGLQHRLPPRMAMSARSSLSGVPEPGMMLGPMSGPMSSPLPGMDRSMSHDMGPAAHSHHHHHHHHQMAMGRALQHSQSLNSAAAMSIDRMMHSGSITSVHSEPGVQGNVPQGLSLEAAMGVHPGRLSDPGTSHLSIPAHVSTVNPVPHMNRVSDSGNTLGLLTSSKALAGLETLLPLVNSALATGQLSLPAVAAAAAQHQQQQQQQQQTASVSSPGSGSPTHSGTATPPSPPMLARRSSSGVADGLASILATQQQQQAGGLDPVPEGSTGEEESQSGGSSPSKAAAAAAAAAAAGGGDPSIAAAVSAAAARPHDATHITSLVARLQEQGLNKDQLVASLSQLLAQLLSVSN